MNKFLIFLATWLLALSGFVVSKVTAPVKVVETNTVIERQGAVASPEFQSKYISIGGVKLEPVQSLPFRISTSTVCSFPLQGTSTPLFVSAVINTATGTAMQFEWGFSNNYDATTTSLLKFTLAADTLGTSWIAATSSADSVDGKWTTQSDFLNLKYGGNACTDGKKCHKFNDVASSTCKAIILKNI